MEDFTALLVMSFPRPWPPPGRLTLAELRQEGRLIYLVAYPDGHIEIAAGSEDQGVTTRCHFQQLAIAGIVGDKAILSVTCADDKIDLRINRQPLKRLSDSEGFVFVVDAQRRVPVTYSIDEPSPEVHARSG